MMELQKYISRCSSGDVSKSISNVVREIFRKVFRDTIPEIIQHAFAPTSNSDNFSSFNVVLQVYRMLDV